jgi:acyl-CoA thioesterase YciA
MTMATTEAALRVMMMPRDANVYGTIFGGVILSYIDQAGYVEAHRHGAHRWVTVSIDRVDFKKPVHIGDAVAFYTHTIKTGKSSVQVGVRVVAERYRSGGIIEVTTATLTMVSVDPRGRSIPFTAPATIDLPDA